MFIPYASSTSPLDSEIADFMSILQHLDANPVSFLSSGVKQRDIGDIKRHLLFDDATGPRP